MHISYSELGWILARSTILLALGGLLIAVLLHWLHIRSASLQRLAWILVLAQGWWVCGIGFDVPVPVFNLAEAAAGSTTGEMERSLTNADEPIDLKEPREFALRSEQDLTSQSFDQLQIEKLSSQTELEAEDAANKLPSHDALTITIERTTQENARISLAALVQFAVTVWLVGGLVVLFKGLYHWLAFQFSLRDTIPARPSWQRQWQALLNQHGIAKQIRILEHDVHGPLLSVTPLGMSVVVPSDYWEELKPCQRLAVLRHELAHFQRGDIWWSLFVRLLAWPHWFNPVAWFAVRRIDECAEWSCDEHLRRAGTAQTTEFAKALIALLEFPGLTPIAARSAGGATSSVRIRRLLAIDSLEESKMKRILLLVSLTAVYASGLLRFQLVAAGGTGAASTSIASPADDEALRDDRISKFAAKLDVDHDSTGTLEKLRAVLLSEAGQVAIGERIANHEYALRQKAETEGTSGYLLQYFDLSNGKYSVKPEQENFAKQLMTFRREIEKDVAEVAAVLRSHQDKVTGSSEADQLLKRIMRDSSASMQMYTRDLFSRIRPDQRLIQEHFAEQFVLNRDNQWMIRASGREQLELLAKRLEDAQRIANRLRRELDAWRVDLDQSNPLASEIKQAMGESSFACFTGLNSLNDDYAIDQIVNEYFDYLEGLFVDRADGLIVVEERLDEFKGAFEQYKSTRRLAEKLRPQLIEFADRIEKGEPLSERLKQILCAEMASIWLAQELDPVDATAAEGAKRLLDEWLETDDQGNMKVRDEQQEAIVNLTREWLRESRSMRRRGQDLDDFAGQLADNALAESFRSPVGNWLVMRTIQSSVARQYFDGLESWTKEHFDLTDDGYLLKAGHEAEVNDVLQQVANLTQELANDDF